jgi:hypothetical protein
VEGKQTKYIGGQVREGLNKNSNTFGGIFHAGLTLPPFSGKLLRIFFNFLIGWGE